MSLDGFERATEVFRDGVRAVQDFINDVALVVDLHIFEGVSGDPAIGANMRKMPAMRL